MPTLFKILTRGLAIGAILACAACVPTEAPPVFITSETPELPDHCDTSRTPNPPEPKLPDADIDDIVATKDRLALKRQIRTLKSYRQACADQLKVLFPQKETALKPTS